MKSLNDILKEYFSKRDDGGAYFNIKSYDDLEHFESFLMETGYIHQFDKQKLNELFEKSGLEFGSDDLVEKTNPTDEEKIKEYIREYLNWLKEYDALDKEQRTETFIIYNSLKDKFNSEYKEYYNDASRIIAKWYNLELNKQEVLKNIEWKNFTTTIDLEKTKRDKTTKQIKTIVEKIPIESIISSFIKKKDEIDDALGNKKSGNLLTNIFPSPAGFIHKSVEGIKPYFQNNQSKDKSATFDFILLNGEATKDKIVDAAKTNNFTTSSTDNCIIQIGNNTNQQFALVSLKYGAAQLGAIGTRLGDIMDNPSIVFGSGSIYSQSSATESNNEINEGVLIKEGIIDNITNSVRNFCDKILKFKINATDKIKNLWNSIKKDIQDAIGKLLSIFTVAKLNNINAIVNNELRELGIIEFKESFENAFPELNEVKKTDNPDTEPIVYVDKPEKEKKIIDTLRKYIDVNGHETDKFKKFAAKVNNAESRIKNIYENIGKVKSIQFSVELPKYSLAGNFWNILTEFHNNLSSGAFAPGGKIPWLAAKKLPVFFGNLDSLLKIDNLLVSMLGDITTINDDTIKNSFLKLSKELFVSAVYGGLQENLPLIKFEDGEIHRLGSKIEFTNRNYINKVPDKIGKILIRRTGKSEKIIENDNLNEGEILFEDKLTIIIYFFAGIEPTAAGDGQFVYGRTDFSDTGNVDAWKTRVYMTVKQPYETVFSKS